jgi:hypothetical protein
MMTEITTSTIDPAQASARLDGVTEPPQVPAELDTAQREAIARMVRQAMDAGIALTGPDGLLKALTAQIVEAALDEELSEHRARSAAYGAESLNGPDQHASTAIGFESASGGSPRRRVRQPPRTPQARRPPPLRGKVPRSVPPGGRWYRLSRTG